MDWVDDVVELGPVKNEYTVGSPRFIAKAFNSTVGVTTTEKNEVNNESYLGIYEISNIIKNKC